MEDEIIDVTIRLNDRSGIVNKKEMVNGEEKVSRSFRAVAAYSAVVGLTCRDPKRL